MSRQSQNFRALFSSFEPEHIQKRKDTLNKLTGSELRMNKQLIGLYEDLLFAHAHPASETEERLAWTNLKRIEKLLRENRKSIPPALENSGLPYVAHTSMFSWELLCWLTANRELHISADFSHCAATPPAEILRVLLPTPLRYEHGFEADWTEWFESVKFLKSSPLRNTLLLFKNQTINPLIRDILFGQLELYCTIYPKSSAFSKMNNRIEVPQTFHHKDLIRKYDFRELLKKELPSPQEINETSRKKIADVIKTSLAVLLRETDPSTYMDISSLTVYHLERGISVALYGMVAERQLPYESYVGFTLFKNGYPASYGGAWVFGHRARFGINIFETFRGGESGFFFTEILRVYSKCFEIDHFEIESYQFGADNPDGIRSGAYWFYYKHGFRSMDRQLHDLAEKESDKIRKNKLHRTSEKVLLEFTKSNMELKLNGATRPDVTSWTRQIRKLFMKESLDKTARRPTSHNTTYSPDETHAMNIIAPVCVEEWTLLLRSGSPFNRITSQKFDKIIEARENDMFRYQQELREIIDEVK